MADRTSAGVHTRKTMKQALWKRLAAGVVHVVVIILLQAAALWLAARIVPRVTLEDNADAIVVSFTMLVAVLVIWPLFMRFFFKVAIYTAGLATIVVNGFIFYVADKLEARLEVANFGWAILFSLVTTMILTALLGFISFQDAGTFRKIALRRERRRIDPEIVGRPGVVFLEIDGLSHDALTRAMAKGKTPNLRRWVDSGSHVLVGWETDLSSQTSAAQAGILHGNNSEIPAFRWFDKSLGRVIVSSSLSLLGPFEESHSDGNGLLADKGSARASMLSGDAAKVMLVASRPLEESMENYRSFFASPLTFTHTLMLVLWEVILETGARWWQIVRDVRPRVSRHFSYAFIRAGMTVALRDLSLNGAVGDMLRGVPYCYVTLAGYDEVAHHSGLDRHDTLTVLRKIDSRLRNLENMAKIAPRDYRFVVLSDHGQTQGATFLQRYDHDLEELVRASVAEGTTVGGPSTYAEQGAGAGVAVGQSDWEHTATVDGAVLESGLGGTWIGRRLHKRLRAGDATPTIVTDVVVMASGNLGLISFTDCKHRLTLEEVERSHPDLIAALVSHPGVGFVMVAVPSGQDGEKGGVAATDAVVIGKQGRHYLGDDRVLGDDPLSNFGRNAARHLRRTSSFQGCPDILVMSEFWAETQENAAFEELVGNHGGLGGEQTSPFISYPTEWELVEAELIGAESVYRNLKEWTTQTDASSEAM